MFNWTDCNAWESEAIRRHAVDQQLGAPVVLAVVEPESTVGLQDRQERTVDPCLSLAGIEDIYCVLLVGSQKGRTLANTSGQKAVRRAVFGGCDAGILRGATLSDGSAAGASIAGTTSAGTRSRSASTGRGPSSAARS